VKIADPAVLEQFFHRMERAGAKRSSVERLERAVNARARPPKAEAPERPTVDVALGQPRKGVEIIREYFAQRYRPDFRRGNMIHCADGGEVRVGEACSVPDSKLIERLALATDAPMFKGGGVNWNALPGFFKVWAKVAFGDILGELPNELEATLKPRADGSPPVAQEQFRRLVREAMLQDLVLNNNGDNGGPTAPQRRPLIQWCELFAKMGPWRDIRGKKVWVKLQDCSDGEVLLKVAVRHELFAQIGADRWLRALGPDAFTDLARKYGVGLSTRKDRPHGHTAVVLADAFVADLLAGLPNDEAPPPAAVGRKE
jgi:hypothetical protein